MQDYIRKEITKTHQLLSQILNDEKLLKTAEIIAEQCIQSLQQGGKILFVCNGGSAADSQHLSAELVSRLCYDRPGRAALALTTDTSALTASGNHYSYETVFARQIEAGRQKNYAPIGISTSGRSPNIRRA